MAGTPEYDLSYSGRVRDDLFALMRRARSAGLGAAVVAAAVEIDRRLRVYP